MATYALVAVKREWCPEWLWWLLRPVIPYQPVRWLLTTAVSDAEEAE